MLLRTLAPLGLFLFASVAGGQAPTPESWNDTGVPDTSISQSTPSSADAETTPPLVESLEAGRSKLSARLGFYDHGDSGDGNPFLDEALTVIEHAVVYDHDVSDTFGYGITFSYDYVSSASIDRLSNFPDQSGASADNYIGVDAGFRHLLEGRRRIDWHLGASNEYDYRSIGFGGGYTWQPRDTNATVSVNLDAYLDSIDIIRFDGTEDGTDDRTSVTASTTWYQILSPRSSGELGVTIAQQSGFLETPYNAVVREDDLLPPNPNLANNARGEELTEELPDDRTRGAVHGWVRTRTEPGRAWELGGRIYSDSWGINSVTVEPRWYQNLVTDTLDMRVRYRFYLQTEADYFDDHFTEPKEFQTQDSDLGDFNTHTFGVLFNWFRGENHSLDFGVDYALRSDGLDHIFASFGWTWGR